MLRQIIREKIWQDYCHDRTLVFEEFNDCCWFSIQSWKRDFYFSFNLTTESEWYQSLHLKNKLNFTWCELIITNTRPNYLFESVFDIWNFRSNAEWQPIDLFHRMSNKWFSFLFSCFAFNFANFNFVLLKAWYHFKLKSGQEAFPGNLYQFGPI